MTSHDRVEVCYRIMMLVALFMSTMIENISQSRVEVASEIIACLLVEKPPKYVITFINTDRAKWFLFYLTQHDTGVHFECLFTFLHVLFGYLKKYACVV